MNKVRNLDNFYVEIDKQLRLVGAYMKDNDLPFLLTMCRLKPHAILHEAEEKKIRLYKWWVDEWGNSLKIKTQSQRKKYYFILNDSALISKKNVCTDLYYCLPLDKMIKMSKLLFLLIGKNQEHTIVASLGIDNFLRVFALINYQWQPISPLQLGKTHLRWIIRHRNDLQLGKSSTNLKKIVCTCKTHQAWLCSWGAQDQIKKIIGPYPFLVDALKLQNKENNG